MLNVIPRLIVENIDTDDPVIQALINAILSLMAEIDDLNWRILELESN